MEQNKVVEPIDTEQITTFAIPPNKDLYCELLHCNYNKGGVCSNPGTSGCIR